jgi:deazaflavin-dependent oxidoreductase (nitroreductase family)
MCLARILDASRAYRRTSSLDLPGRATSVNPRDRMPSKPAPVPPDDLSRKLTAARPDHHQSPPHLRLVGDTDTILVTGEETAGKYTLIDMHVPPGGGPPPHRHDFEELTSPADQFNERTIAAFRASHGRVGDTFDSAPLLLLHTVGARSGQPRINPVRYLADGDQYLVFAAKAGADTNPDWYWNLRANPDATIEVGDETIAVRATELTGAERDEKYRAQSERYPGFAGYQQVTSRTIPVIALTRHEPPAPGAGGMDRRMLRALAHVTACRHTMPVALGHGRRVLRS